MDTYLKPTKLPSTASSSTRAPSVKPAEGKPRPYATLADAPKASTASASLNKIQGGIREANRALIKTLGKEDNPITNSTAYQRTLHVQSCSTGHQGGGGPGRSWNLTRNAKLTVQAANAETNTLKGVIACISGYTGDDITNMQLRELVQHQGGKMVTVPSARCTHVFIRENLSGSKAQKFLESNRKNGTKLVTPQWAIECARRGRRVSEAQFAAPVYNEAQESAYTIFTAAAARGSVSPSDASTSSSISPPALAGPSTSSTSFFPPVPPAAPSTPRARTRSQTGSSPRRTSLLPAAPVARSTSPRKRPTAASTTSSTSASMTASATSLLLAQLAAQAAQRSHGGDVSPGREARTGTKRRSTHVATWECAGHVRSPPRYIRMALRLGVDLRPPQPVPSPAHGRLASTSSPTEPPTSTRPSSPAAAYQRPPSALISRRPNSHPATALAGSSSSSLVPGQPTEDDWWRFSAPKRGDAERGAPLRSTVPRQRGMVKRGEPAFKMVGEWRVGDSLGKGTGGTVRLAVSVKTGQYAAVKKVARVPDGHKVRAHLTLALLTLFLRSLSQTDLQHGHHAAREISLLKLVAPHPHFIQLYDVFETPSHFFLVTEYCSLGALFDYVNDHILEPCEVQKLFLELVSALTHLNRFRIAHRDLKPENLLLCRDEHDELTLKIADMGLASFQPENTLLKTSCGSPHYAAPEIVSGLPYDGALADVWSAGVVLYAMLANALPFDDDNNPALFAKIRSGVYKDHPDVPPDARDLIAHCLVVDPSERYTILEVAAHPFLLPNPYSPGPLSLAALYPPAPTLASPPSADTELDETVLASLKVVLQTDSVGEAEWLLRAALLLGLVGFRHPRSLEPHEQHQHGDHSSFLTSAFDDASCDASSQHTRSASAPELAFFPLPPSTVGGRASETAQTDQKEQSGRAQGVLVPLSSSEDGHIGSDGSLAPRASYEAINRDYTFPLGPPPSPVASTLPLPTSHLEVPTSAPPQIESFGTRATSPSPYCLGSPMRPSVERSSTGKSSGSGGSHSHSLPATPTGIRIDPAFLAASRPSHDSSATATGTASASAPSNEERGVRPRPSMHQRLRSLFHGAGSKRTSLIKDAAPSASSSPISFELVSPQPTPSPMTGTVSPTQRHPHKLIKRQSTAFAAPRTSTPTSRPRPPSIAPSARTSTSSHLKRSPALSNLSHALHEYQPLSPILSPELAEFGELLALGASAPCSPRLLALEAGPRASEPAAKRSSMAMMIFQDSPSSQKEPSRPIQPRSSSLRVPHSVSGRENAPSARVRQALNDKVSSPTPDVKHVKSTWRSSAPAGGPSAVPTVKLDRINAHDDPASASDAPTTSSKTKTGPRRNPSLSIQVPPRPASLLHPAHALTAPTRTSTPTRASSSSPSPTPPVEYEHRVSQLRAHNRALHAQLADEMAEHDDEVNALRLEVRALHDERDAHDAHADALLRQVDELVEYAGSLAEENAQLRRELERAWSGSVRSRASSGIRGGGGSSTISIYSSDGRRERVLQGEWVGARGGAFEDELRDEGSVEL
ncbi:hypothetical protein JCM9279_006017 [Rhodotorula babjevae]